jgi:glycine/D-amino acid oxidase-like deaminating enzyme
MSDTKNPDAIPDPLATNDTTTDLGRREFLQLAGAGTAAAFAQTFTPAPGIDKPKKKSGSPSHVIVIGAGAWGSWTAYHLVKSGVKVTIIDQYGAANSRATSADETRGIRSSYGDRADETAPLWTKWARTAIARWHEFDKEWGPQFRTRFFVETGDVICRATDEPFTKRTRELWTAQGVKHEVLTGDEVRKRWPVMNSDDTTIALYEPDAGVARARASTQAINAIAQKMGATLKIGRVRPGLIVNNKMDGVIFDDGTILRGDAYVWACGPWLGKVFPYLKSRVRVPLGFVCYFATPVGDNRFTYPSLPSYNFPGVTGWVTLPVDSRGFRVRGAIAAPSAPGATPGGGRQGGATAAGATPPANAAAGTTPPATPPKPRPADAPATPLPPPGAGRQGAGRQAGAAAPGAAPATPPPPPDPTLTDPDLSSRWMSQERIDGSRRFLARRFPLLKDAPLSETRACHYEGSINRNFIIDHLPGLDNAWVAGLGQSEGFKFGPVVGEYIAMRVLGNPGDPAIAKAFHMPTEEYETE